MLTQVKSPREIFYMPQRLSVPLFQRPYVWSLETQWQPLWEDVARIAQKILNAESDVSHFLGAVVLQQQVTQVNDLPHRTIIDGQQRLSTLQLLLDAIKEELVLSERDELSRQVADLVENAPHFVEKPEDRFKVWPTNRDRASFHEVMTAIPPIDYRTLTYGTTKFARAHDYFSNQARAWIALGESHARALVSAVTGGLQLVVIELQPDENAQEIFETLNARMTPLTAADLIKNFVFQSYSASQETLEEAYEAYWRQFETDFWEEELSIGRVRFPRSSLFLTQWLVSRTHERTTIREVFGDFKRYVTDGALPIETLLPSLHQAAALYQRMVLASQVSDGPLSRLEFFVYRTSTMDSEVMKPILLWLLNPDAPSVPQDQIDKAVSSLESWMVRRMLVRASSAGYTDVMLGLLLALSKGDRNHSGDIVEAYLQEQISPSSYWPSDDEVKSAVREMPIYRRLTKARIRMLLEALEDHSRGFDSGSVLHEQRIVRGKCTIEHVMPISWDLHWPLSEDSDNDERDEIVHQLGNLTLVTQALNSKVSNGPWAGETGKRAVLTKYSSMKITQQVVDLGQENWNEDLIQERSRKMTDALLQIWPAPAGHEGLVKRSTPTSQASISLADLVDAGLLHTGQTLYARRGAHAGRTCLLKEDGLLQIGNEDFTTPSGAATKTVGKNTNGWIFWRTGQDGDGHSLDDLASQYQAN